MTGPSTSLSGRMVRQFFSRITISMLLALQISQATYITKRRRSSRANVLTQQMMQSDVIDVFITQLIFITNLPRMAIGTTVRAENK